MLGCRPLGSTVRGTDAPVSFLPRGQQAFGLPEVQPSLPLLRAEDSRGAWWRRRPQSDTALHYSLSPTAPGSVLWAAASRCQPGTDCETCALPAVPRHSRGRLTVALLLWRRAPRIAAGAVLPFVPKRIQNNGGRNLHRRPRFW